LIHQLFLAKLPNFLDVDPRPFESASYRPEDDEDEEQVRLRIENTVRWRYIRDAQGNLKGRESNSRVIRWSDGTLSLLLGDELFEIVVQSMDNDYQYLVAHHTEEGLFQTQAQFKRLMTFRPQGTHSMTHKKLTMAIATKHKKEQRLKMFASREDPEKLKQEAERLENEKLKARRRLEAKQRSAAAKYGLNEDFLEEEEEEMRYRQGDAALTKALDEYEQDDFGKTDSGLMK
jgi:RNA polymerase-associated protein LEO1